MAQNVVCCETAIRLELANRVDRGNSTTTASPKHLYLRNVGVGSIRSPRSVRNRAGARSWAGAGAVLRPISWARRGNGLNQTLAQTEIEQLDVRIDAEL